MAPFFHLETKTMTYRAPVKDMLFVMKELAGLDAVAALALITPAGTVQVWTAPV